MNWSTAIVCCFYTFALTWIIIMFVRMKDNIPYVDSVTEQQSYSAPRRPEKCKHLMRVKDPSTWDPIKEEYPRNIAWEQCMGVGYVQ